MLNANELLQKGLEQVKAAGITPGKINPIVKINTKSIQRMGQCSRNPDGTYQIEINSVLLTSNNEKAAMTTMVHEILHSVQGCMNHGPKWKSVVAIMNKKYDYNIKRCSSYEERGIEQPKGKYSILCTNKKCGKRYEKNRISGVVKNPERYCCGECKGKLKVIHNQQTTNAANHSDSPKRNSTKITKPKFKYIIQCTKCKHEYGRNQMSKVVKNVSMYKCKCGGNLKLL